ncbi:MAG: hypothetical protein AAFU79_09390 [Myxococcota bacterium]
MFEAGPVALLAFIVFPFVVYAQFTRMSGTKATAVALMLATLYLPAGEALINLPVLPPMGRESFGTVFALIFLLTFHRKRFMSAKPGRGLEFYALMLMIPYLMTWKTNPEPLVYGFKAVPGYGARVFIPPLTFGDVRGYWLEEFAYVLIPFIVGRAMFRTRNEVVTLLNVIVAFGVTYIPLMLLELRMSPQIHTWVYGYFPHPDFTQTIRWGGYRAQVFFEHGLVLARFMLVLFLANAALYLGNEKKAWRFTPRELIPFLFVVSILGKSMGAIIFLFAFSGLIFFVSLGMQTRVLALVALLICAYPYGRSTGALDMTPVVEYVQARYPQRAESLLTRVNNERALSKRGREKFWYGWGGWSRSHVWDVEHGIDTSVTDGYWIIRFGRYGVFGLILPFLLLLGPVFLLWWRRKKIKRREDLAMMCVMAGICTLYALENLPNAVSTGMPWLMAGATTGFLTTLTNPKAAAVAHRYEEPEGARGKGGRRRGPAGRPRPPMPAQAPAGAAYRGGP